MAKKPKEPVPPAPATPPAGEKGKTSAAILESLKTIEGQNVRILKALEPGKTKRTRRNMFGEDVDEEE